MTVTPVKLKAPSGRIRTMYLAQQYFHGRLICSVTGHTRMYAITNAMRELTRVI